MRMREPVAERRSRLLPVLILAMAMAPLVSYSASALSPRLVAEFHTTSAQYGLFATVSFLSGALFSRLVATASDRLSDRTQIGVIFGFAVVSLIILAYATNFAWFLVAAFVSGPSHALCNPFTNRMIVRRVSPDLRGRWMGIKQAGVQLSQAFAGLVLPLAASILGWRLSLGILACTCLFLLLSSVRQTAQVEKTSPSTAAVDFDFVTKPTVSYSPKAVRLLATYALLSGTGVQATNVYTPLFSQKELGFSFVSSGLTVAVAGGIGLCARIYWGRLMATSVSAGIMMRIAALAASLGAACLAAAGVFQSGALLWVGIVLHGATALGSNVIVMSSVLRYVPARRAGSASAVVGMAMYLGFAMGPLLISAILAFNGDIAVGWLTVAIIYLIAALVSRTNELGRIGPQ